MHWGTLILIAIVIFVWDGFWNSPDARFWRHWRKTKARERAEAEAEAEA